MNRYPNLRTSQLLLMLPFILLGIAIGFMAESLAAGIHAGKKMVMKPVTNNDQLQVDPLHQTCKKITRADLASANAGHDLSQLSILEEIESILQGNGTIAGKFRTIQQLTAPQ